MPSDIILESAIDDVVDSLNVMSKANGYWYDYQPVRQDAAVDWDTVKDTREPAVHVYWDGTLPPDDETGNEMATSRYRHTERIVVEVAVKDPERKIGRALRRIRWDVHKALMATGRQRGLASSGVNTFDAGVEALDYVMDGATAIGGVITMVYHIRWDHQTGDMTAR